jgi:hypothetical protein
VEFDLARGAFALADGAGEGIFSKLWARLLTSEYVRSRPDPGDPAALGAWLQDCRRAWLEGINYRALRWSQINKVDHSGAAATFLTLDLTEAAPAGEEGPVAWRSWAVGDSCLFWARDNRLQAAFPVAAAADFGLTPALLRTKADHPDPPPQTARGRCRPGDVFLLATDAVAGWLLRCCEAGRPPDWERYADLDEAVWGDEIDRLRRENEMVNDDCTVLWVRILPADAG